MKKVYVAPTIEIERYELNSRIAASCDSVVTMGPGDDAHITCSEFEDAWETAMFALDKSFYNDGIGTSNCTCYYSAAGEGYYTS